MPYSRSGRTRTSNLPKLLATFADRDTNAIVTPLPSTGATSQSALRVSWGIINDEVTFRFGSADKPNTGRFFSNVSSLFDPLELVAPPSLLSKQLQKL